MSGMDTDRSDKNYRPPEISDIDAPDDREFAVTPGGAGSDTGGRN